MCLSLPLCLSFVILFLVLLKYRRYKKLQAAAPGAALWLPLTFRHECVVPRMRQQSHSSCYARHAPSTCEAVFPRYRSLPKQKLSSFKVHLFLFLSLPPSSLSRYHTCTPTQTCTQVRPYAHASKARELQLPGSTRLNVYKTKRVASFETSLPLGGRVSSKPPLKVNEIRLMKSRNSRDLRNVRLSAVTIGSI